MKKSPTYPTWEASPSISRFELCDPSVTFFSCACEIFAAVESLHLIVEFSSEFQVKDRILGNWQGFAEEKVDDLRLGEVNRLDRLEDISVIHFDSCLLNL